MRRVVHTAGVAAALVAMGLGSTTVLAQSRPAGGPDAVESTGDVGGTTRSLARVPAPDEYVADSEIMLSRPGGCPEGPPCPDESAAEVTGEAEKCEGPSCPEKK